MNFMDEINMSQYEDVLQRARRLYEELQNENKRLRKQLREHDKDDEIQKLQARCASLSSRCLHTLSGNELHSYQLFRANHYKSCKNGNTFICTLTGTGIGEGISVKCPVCGVEENITDTESW